MLELLKDPAWIAIILAILTLATIIILPIMSRRTKKLAFEVEYDLPLLLLEDDVPERLHVTYDGEIVKDVYLIMIKIKNSGRLPIRSSDFESPICISFGESTSILSAEIAETEPEGLAVTTRIKDQVIEIPPSLINNGDSFTIKIIASGYSGDEDISVSGRIAGIKEIEEYHFVVGIPWAFYLVILVLALGSIRMTDILEGSYKWLGLLPLAIALFLIYRRDQR